MSHRMILPIPKWPDAPTLPSLYRIVHNPNVNVASLHQEYLYILLSDPSIRQEIFPASIHVRQQRTFSLRDGALVARGLFEHHDMFDEDFRRHPIVYFRVAQLLISDFHKKIFHLNNHAIEAEDAPTHWGERRLTCDLFTPETLKEFYLELVNHNHYPWSQRELNSPDLMRFHSSRRRYEARPVYHNEDGNITSSTEGDPDGSGPLDTSDKERSAESSVPASHHNASSDEGSEETMGKNDSDNDVLLIDIRKPSRKILPARRLFWFRRIERL